MSTFSSTKEDPKWYINSLVDILYNQIDARISYNKLEQVWNILFIQGEPSYIIDISWELIDTSVKEVSREELEETQREAEQKLIESLTEFELEAEKVKLFHQSILEALETYNQQRWWIPSIDHSLRVEHPEYGDMSFIEACLMLERSIGWLRERKLGLLMSQKDKDTHAIQLWQIDDMLWELHDSYLLLMMGVGDMREKVPHILPKTSDQIQSYIWYAISRRSPEEILIFLEDLHTLIADNNRQDRTTRNNYEYLISLAQGNAWVRLKSQILENTQSPSYGKLDILYRFAELISGRGIDIDVRVRSDRLPPSNLALEVLEHILVFNGKEEWEKSIIAHISDHIDLQDESLWEYQPAEILTNFALRLSESMWLEDSEGETIAQEFDEPLRGNIISLFARIDELGNYSSLSYTDALIISTLSRVSENLIGYTMRSVWAWRNKREVRGASYIKNISKEELNILLSEASQEATRQLWESIQSELDDSFWEKFKQFVLWQLYTGKSDKERMSEIGIHPESIEAQILLLYMSIQGLWNIDAISDTNMEYIKTAGHFMAAIVATMTLGFWAIWWLALAWRSLSLIQQGMIYGAISVPIGQWIDVIAWEQRSYANNQEAFASIITESMLAVGAWAVWGLIATKLGRPEAAFFSKENNINQAIFAWDLTILSIIPEAARITIMDQIYHNRWIYIETWDWEELIDTLISQKIQSLLLFPEEKLIGSVFWWIGLEQEDIPQELDERFQRAYATMMILEPGYLSRNEIFYLEPEFQEVYHRESLRSMAQDSDYTPLLEAIETWSAKQLARLERLQTH